MTMIREEARLNTVASLSRHLLRQVAPEQSLAWERDLARWLAAPPHLAVQERLPSAGLPLSAEARRGRPPASPKPQLPTEGLDTTLVAGMFLQVILEAENLPGTPLERSSFVKRAVKNFLVQRLAGQITLSQFFRLIQLIEEEVSYYFQRLQGQWLAVPTPAPEPPPAAAGWQPPRLRRAELQAALERLPLPQQANRKLSPEGLLAFLEETQGNWFRLLDFETHFHLNKKTAWSYLTLLWQENILRHNDQKANKARYALAERFLAAPGEPSG
jgi:hypothetical protein